jgi:hypothetical protein
VERGNIADSVYDGERTIPQALRDIRKLPDPLAEFKDGGLGLAGCLCLPIEAHPCGAGESAR